MVDGYIVTGPADRAGLEVRAASVRGLAHRYYGTVRQDSYAVRLSDDRRWLIAAVADGVSAGAHSHVAADTACLAATLEVCILLAAGPPQEIDWASMFARVADRVAAETRVQLGRCARDPGADLATLAAEAAATLIVAVEAVEAAADGSREVHLCGVGDTSGWRLGGNGWHRLLGGKSDGVLANSATAALPVLPSHPPQPVRTVVPAEQALVLMTDGIGDPLGDGAGEVGAFLAAQWRGAPPPLEFAAQIDFARRSYDDDRTAIAVWPLEGP
ncbi:protein phosphatase 2C domain-containing protein [Actinomycetospora chiangmaiensis]|uniref:protein phosphatase 2C domain-containing protein n=1 Tax=Actinomycetospora chiangmaiensis TaxID=402650 RepID=UPI0012FAFF36|nr:protein phosphatase 2C domain-containing protein [Actinomycetospora chiangmaiensis]